MRPISMMFQTWLVLVFTGCSQMALTGGSSFKEKAHQVGLPESDKQQDGAKGETSAPSQSDGTASKDSNAAAKHEENFVSELATKNMDLIVSVETIGNQEEITRIDSFLKTLATRTAVLGPNLRRTYVGSLPLNSFPDALTQYETSQTVMVNAGSGLPTLAAALAANDPTVAPRPDSQLTVMIISATDTNPVTFDMDDDGNQIPVYPDFSFPKGTQAFGLLKLNPSDLQNQVACGSQISTNAANVVQKYNGRSFDLCESDVDTIAGYVAYAMSHRNRIFQLRYPPNAKFPVEVFVNDQLVDPKDYDVSQFSWSVEFRPNYALKAGDKVKVIYQGR